MSPRALFVVAALAVVAVALAVVGQRRSAPAARLTTAPVLPGLAERLDQLGRVTLVGAGGETAVTLERAPGAWTVAERDAYPADLAQLRAALVALSEARVIEPKTADPGRYASIGVADIGLESATGTLVRLEAEDGSSRALILGSSDRAEERYARRPGEARSLLMDRNPDMPLDPAEWLAPEIVDVDDARVRSVAVRHADGATLELARAEPSQRDFAVAGVPEGRVPDGAAVDATGAALAGLRLEDVARFAPEQAGEPRATVAYSTFDGLDVHVAAYRIEAEDWLTFDASAAESAGAAVRGEADSIAARVGGWRYRVASERYDAMLRRLDDLLAPAQ